MFPMTEEQLRFHHWVKEKAPYLVSLWDWEEKSLLLDDVKNYLGSASHGEGVMCKFFTAVWLGKNDFKFDFFEAASSLDVHGRNIISDWLKDPFWP